MLRQERAEDPSEALRLALLGWQAGIWTAMPGILDSFDATEMTAVVQPAIQGIFRQKDGTEKTVTMPQCLDCPVIFPGGGGYTLTFPLGQGATPDEGLLVFASRCIDSWWQNGGVQPPAEIRFHDLSDGFFIPGVRSVPRVLQNISTTSVQLRADDKSSYVDIAAGLMTLKHQTKVVVDSPVAHFTGSIEAEGEITRGVGGSDSVTLGQHNHPTAPTGPVSKPTPGT